METLSKQKDKLLFATDSVFLDVAVNVGLKRSLTVLQLYEVSYNLARCQAQVGSLDRRKQSRRGS